MASLFEGQLVTEHRDCNGTAVSVATWPDGDTTYVAGLVTALVEYDEDGEAAVNAASGYRSADMVAVLREIERNFGLVLGDEEELDDYGTVRIDLVYPDDELTYGEETA